nr:ATPase P [candidate division Zixibacteria bacterium]
MIELDIPGVGEIRLAYLVADFSGTLSVDGIIPPEIIDRLNSLAEILEIHILTSDTHGKAKTALQRLNGTMQLLSGDRHDIQKEKYTRKLGAERVIALGNGNNDVLMLSSARIGIAVCLNEGCSGKALAAADILVTSIDDALALLEHPARLKATLRV